MGAPHVAAAASVGGTASIVVDGATGRVISAMNENAPRHPASITKVMTLYLLFEQLEKGKLSLDDEIPVSAHAAAQAPSKLGLRPGQTIRVEDAIKVIVTKSANDIAVAVAEAVGGTESEFADMMTRKAHALGMTHTLYRNASGLPNDEQITTASDLAMLGRTIQANFPRYYRYFSHPRIRLSRAAHPYPQPSDGSLRRHGRHQDRLYRGLRLQPARLRSSATAITSSRW